MKRRRFIRLVGGAIAGWPFAAAAQEAGRTYRIAGLSPVRSDSPSSRALVDELARQGFVEGKNLTIDDRDYGQQVELVPKYAAELVKAQPDLIVATGDAAIRAAQKATKTIPILGLSDDMVGAGLVSSMARPEGNTTGVSILSTELDGKRLEILLEAVPALRKVAVLADSNRTSVAKLDALQKAAQTRNVDLSIQRVAKAEDVSAAIDAAKASGAAGLSILASPMLFANRRVILDKVAALRLPTIYQWPDVAEEGGLLGYGPRLTQVVREIYARQAVELLRGAKAADVPVEQPTKFALAINLKTADALGLTLAPTLLARADKVIE